jgi:hypothetical protein
MKKKTSTPLILTVFQDLKEAVEERNSKRQTENKKEKEER